MHAYGIPRRDAINEHWMQVAPAGPMGVATAIAFQPGIGKVAVTGDFVLSDAEVTPVIAACVPMAFEITAIHSHMFSEQPQ